MSRQSWRVLAVPVSRQAEF